ncbi:unnamed protein product [Lactuca virosa]|uniref:F-box domain-containing protein n=1 Tax=Lactuca virosa TaxID=75947 RepID=A0AAU9PCX8_9ASTR|nr:unnamed protein product [Lactuca virosa]
MKARVALKSCNKTLEVTTSCSPSLLPHCAPSSPSAASASSSPSASAPSSCSAAAPSPPPALSFVIVKGVVLKMMSKHEIPFHIQEEIMKRLPVKSLIQFRCVSKEWKSLIESSEFIAAHSLWCHTHPQHLLVLYEDPKASTEIIVC